MKETAKNSIFHRIYGRGKSWVFSGVDFLPEFKRWEIDRSLADLATGGKIRRILPGLYYFPKYSELLKEFVAPNIPDVAEALARKYNWNIFPEGNTALNYLGLSTQVPAKYAYISNGSARKYKIGNMTLEFLHRVPTESMITDKNTMLVVQAIKAFGQAHIDDKFIQQLTSRFSPDEWKKIKKHASKTTGWVYEIITKIADR